jgi:hypothetical protein
MSTTAPPVTPTPFILKERFTRIDCPLDGYAGLWFEVRMNLSNGELHALREAVRDVDDRITDVSDTFVERADEIDARLKAIPTDDRVGRRAIQREITQIQRECEDALFPLHVERRNLVAPHVRAWNLFEPNPDGGEPRPIPPPREQPESLADLGPDVVRWLCQEVLTAYAGGRGFTPGSETSGTAPEPGRMQSSGGPQIREPLSPSRTSRTKSRGR